MFRSLLIQDGPRSRTKLGHCRSHLRLLIPTNLRRAFKMLLILVLLARLDLNQRPPVYRTGATNQAELRARNLEVLESSTSRCQRPQAHFVSFYKERPNLVFDIRGILLQPCPLGSRTRIVEVSNLAANPNLLTR